MCIIGVVPEPFDAIGIWYFKNTTSIAQPERDSFKRPERESEFQAG
jgi:hypothetical protein